MRKSILTLILISTSGCVMSHGPVKTPYNGPTQTMAEVIGEINSNNQKVPTLWSTLYYKANIVDEQKHAHFVNGDGVLVYQQPGRLRLVGKKDPIGQVFDIGSNSDFYWLRVIPEISTMWYGRYKDLEAGEIEPLKIPIRPDLVMGVLTITTLNTNFNALPAPTMRFNNMEDAYEFVWIAKAPDRWVAVREVWYDRKSKQPKFVLLYDANGRVALRADLKIFKQLEVPGLAKDKWPTVPTDYNFVFPDTGSTMEFTLSDDMALTHSGAPNPKSFAMPSPENPGVDHVIQIGTPAKSRGPETNFVN